MPLKMKRIYDPSDTADGIRILIDGLWPRGIAKSEAHISEWMKVLAPSASLRQWFGHQQSRWKEFTMRYREELKMPERREALSHLRSLKQNGTVTLVFAARDEAHSNAKVLYDVLNGRTGKTE